MTYNDRIRLRLGEPLEYEDVLVFSMKVST